MKRYVVLLRGINVGGKNKLSMKELKLLFENIGYKDIVTYINSGNIIFSSNENEIQIKETCEREIMNTFHLDLQVKIISVEELSNALDNVPDWWDQDKRLKHNAIFVIPPSTAKELVEKVGFSEYERVSYHGSVIFWSAHLENFSKTKWSKAVSTTLSKSVTIRNANTTKKLLEIGK